MKLMAKAAGALPFGEMTDAFELGAVSDHGVRVWLRHPVRDEIEVRLETAGREFVVSRVVTSAERDFTAATVLSLREPAPNAAFTVRAGERSLTGRFAPAPDEHASFAFGVGSCHFPFVVDDGGEIRPRPSAAIYPAIAHDLRAADARFLLAIGDQIYADALPGLSVRDDLPGDADHPPPLEAAIAGYRRVTRGFFAEPGFRALRQTFPTLCMWDDHDIYDNRGSATKESALDRTLFAAATRVFSEYQDARNPSGGARTPPFDFFHRYGTAGVYLLDLRGARSYSEGRLLGRPQWERFRAFLDGDEAASLHTLFVVATVPLAHAARWFAPAAERVPGSYGEAARDRWIASAFRESRNELLEALFDWQTRERHRQVVLLSGDIHEADAVAIRRRDEPGTIWQFTCSAFTSPPSARSHALNWLTTRAPSLFERRFRFERAFLVARNNVGLVSLRALAGGGHEIRMTVRAWDEQRRALYDAGDVVATPLSTA